jgi:hypothetical protein
MKFKAAGFRQIAPASGTFCNLYQRHGEPHQLTADGIKGKAYGFQGMSPQERAVVFLAKDDHGDAHLVLILEQRSSRLPPNRLAVGQADRLLRERIDSQPLKNRSGNDGIQGA